MCTYTCVDSQSLTATDLLALNLIASKQDNHQDRVTASRQLTNLLLQLQIVLESRYLIFGLLCFLEALPAPDCQNMTLTQCCPGAAVLSSECQFCPQGPTQW